MTASRHRGRTRRPPSRGSRQFSLHREAWWGSAGFERREPVTAAGAQWTVVYRIRTRRRPADGGDTLELMSSVTVWPVTTPRRPRASGALEQTVSAWRRRVQSTLRRRGYHGRWEESPEGRFGDFWKSLPNAAAVAVEVKRLERLRL